jgi:hypothetical protein
MFVNVNTYGKPLTLNEISEAVCRIRVGVTYGTGTCVGKTADNQHYLIFTNGHVVGRQSQGTVEFFRSGYKTTPLPADVIYSNVNNRSDVDFGFMQVHEKHFGDYPPRIIKMMPPDCKLSVGNYIAAVGCPDARWAQAWEGHITEHKDSRVLFIPAPVGGQSGSGVMVLVYNNNTKEWETKLGAILTWRIPMLDGAKFCGGAIPVTTLYSVLNNTYTSYRVPVSYRPVSLEVPTAPLNTVPKTQGVYALGSNNKLYRVYLTSDGSKTVILGSDYGVQILTWDYYNSPYYQNSAGVCPPGGCPPGNAAPNPRWQPFGGRFQPNQPDNQQPEVPPYTQPQQPDGNKPNNPYGVVPPNLWQDNKPEAVPVPSNKPVVKPPVVQNPNEDVSFLAGLFGRTRDRVNSFFGGIMVAVGGGLFVFAWNKFIKKRVITRVDSLQDYLEQQVKAKWGPELAKEARDIMEGVEDALLGFADDFIADSQAKKQVAKSIIVGKPAERIRNGSSNVFKNVTVPELVAAVNEAAKEVGDDSITTEIPAKVADIVGKIAKK